MYKNIKEIIDDMDRIAWGAGEKERRQRERRSAKERIDQMEKTDIFVPVQKLKCVRDSTITIRAPRPPITSPETGLAIFRAYFKDVDREIVAVMPVDSQKQYLSVTTVAMGTIDHVVVHPREVFKTVLAQANAAGFLIAHNHPSGEVKMSNDDWAMLEDLRKIGLSLDCPMLDFIILGDGTENYYSHHKATYELSGG